MLGNRIFKNREDAGHALVERLPTFDPNSTVIVALPRGGVPIGAIIAGQNRCPLEVLLVRKIGMPGNPEVALGAVAMSENMQVSINEDIMTGLGLRAEDVKRLAEKEIPELEHRRHLYFGDRLPMSLNGKTVVLVDDGVATGATMEVALRLVKSQNPAKIILALPVAPASTIARLSILAGDLVCLSQPNDFLSVGSYYEDFRQVENDEVIKLLTATDALLKEENSSVGQPI